MIEQPMYPGVTADTTKRVGSWGRGRDHHNCTIILQDLSKCRED
jgi:hypothetical protein